MLAVLHLAPVRLAAGEAAAGEQQRRIGQLLAQGRRPERGLPGPQAGPPLVPRNGSTSSWPWRTDRWTCGKLASPDMPTRPSCWPASTSSPGRTATLPWRRWQYCVSQPSPCMMTTPLPQLRPSIAAMPMVSTETSSMPSRMLRTFPAAAASTGMPARIAARSAMAKSVPECLSAPRSPHMKSLKPGPGSRST